MVRVSSKTGLSATPVEKTYKPRSRISKLTSFSKTASFKIPSFEGSTPRSAHCSMIYNDQTRYRRKELLRRTKESWMIEGKSLFPHTENEEIERNKFYANKIKLVQDDINSEKCIDKISTKSGKIYDHHNETDLHFQTTTPTTMNFGNKMFEKTPSFQERTILVLDLRTDVQNQEVNTFSWHAIILESQPSPRKSQIQVLRPVLPCSSSETALTQTTISSTSDIENCNTTSIQKVECDETKHAKSLMRRKGKTIKKGKYRRGSIHGQQTEVRDPPEPRETQVSQIDDATQKDILQSTSGHAKISTTEDSSKPSLQVIMTSSFICLKILKLLSREIDRETVEEEFSLKKQVILQEALRMTSNVFLNVRGSCQNIVELPRKNAQKLFSRQSARFELLDSQSLLGLTPMDYLKKHVFVTKGRKLVFSRTLNKYCEKTINGDRHILPKDIVSALEEIIGKSINVNQEQFFFDLIAKISVPLDFRNWCGICALAERLLCNLPPKVLDPPTWIEKIDFEVLDQIPNVITIDSNLKSLLYLLRDR